MAKLLDWNAPRIIVHFSYIALNVANGTNGSIQIIYEEIGKIWKIWFEFEMKCIYFIQIDSNVS